jgi:uncharacterized delta-60 repeat protein
LCCCPATQAADTPALDNFFPSFISVRAAIPQADGKILVSGSSVARVNSDGTVDPQFQPPGLRDAVNTLALLDDGKILYAGYSGSFLGRLNVNGDVDTTFAPNFYPTTFGMDARPVVVQSDGSILIGGDFTFSSPAVLSRVCRLHANGSVDTGFAPRFSSTVNCLALQPNGKCVVGGQFSSVSGSLRNRMALLNANGTLDETFAPNVSGSGLYYVWATAVQADGKVLLGGSFDTVGGQPRAAIARVLPDGTVDASFNPGITGTVRSIVLQTDGNILVGGSFTSVAGQPRQNVARLNADGTLDPAFTAEAKGYEVSTLAIQKDGKLLVGGSFTNLGSVNCTNLGRLLPTDGPYEAWSREGDELLWLRGGSGPELCRARFEYSSDGATWLPLGEGVRAPGGWKVGGLSALPGGSTIRCTGYVRGGRYSGSGWWFQSSVELAKVVALRILSEDSSFGLNGQRFGFKISGPPGQPFRVETSTDLVHWTPIWTNNSGSNPVFFSDPQPADGPQRMYRVRYQ